MSSRRPSRSLPLAAIAGLALLVAGAAQAQPSPGGGGWMMMGGGFGGGRSLLTPEFTRADMSSLVDVLRLDDTQMTIAEALLLDYESAFLEALDEMQAGVESDDGLDVSMRERQEKRRAMREQFRTIGEKLRAQRELEGEIDEETMEAVRAKFEAMRMEMAALRPTEAEMDVLRDRFRTLRTEWRRERLGLRSLFVANMQAILTEDQLPDWDRFERQVRRRHSIDRGMLSAESVDLLLILNEMGVGEKERQALQEVLESYEVELDAALVTRNAYLDEDRDAMFDAMRGGDTDTVRRKLLEESKLRIAVRDVNESYADLLTELLRDRRMAPGEAGFHERYLERAFPRIFRPTAVERSFDAVRRFEDIPQEFMEPILNLEEAYLAELDTINDRLLAATRQHEAEQMLSRFERRMNRARATDAGSADGGRAPDPIDDIREQRNELDERYRRQLESVLTEDQIDALPSMREGARRFEGRGPRDFGDGRGGNRGRGG